MKKSVFVLLIAAVFVMLASYSCKEGTVSNTTAVTEQALTEANQATLLANQPPPKLTWSLERDNLIKRFKLMNDRSIMFYMYIFNYGVEAPIGYYQVNKVSSVNSQLTSMQQIISGKESGNNLPLEAAVAIESPAEDGSYGTNGDGVFGFTPDEIYIEHNMQYICSTVPLAFKTEAPKLIDISVEDLAALKTLMAKIDATE